MERQSWASERHLLLPDREYVLQRVLSLPDDIESPVPSLTDQSGESRSATGQRDDREERHGTINDRQAYVYSKSESNGSLHVCDSNSTAWRNDHRFFWEPIRENDEADIRDALIIYRKNAFLTEEECVFMISPQFVGRGNQGKSDERIKKQLKKIFLISFGSKIGAWLSNHFLVF